MKITFIALFVTGSAVAGCSGESAGSSLSSEEDADSVSESGGTALTDTVQDTQTETLEPPNECPVNSGWPCACETASVKFCDDQSACVQVGLGDRQGSSGFCSRSCDGREDLESCKNVSGFGLQGACVLLENGKNSEDGTPTQCALVCEYQGGTGSVCPSGLECVPVKLRDPSMSLCL